MKVIEELVRPGVAPGGAVPVSGATGVCLRGVDKSFLSRGQPVEALQGVDLEVAAGEFVCVVGASGCGKSTLLRLVAGFEQPSRGTVDVNGQRVHSPGPDRGVVFQDYGLFPWLSASANIAYGPRRRRLPRAQVQALVDRFIELVGLSSFAERYPHELSGGMQQRVAIARVLANDPAVLLMDEPFGALDSLTREAMQIELHRIWNEVRPTVILVTHSVEEAVFLADRVVVMTGGPNRGVPGRVARVVEVELDHPRDTTAVRFNELKRELLAAIRSDVQVPT